MQPCLRYIIIYAKETLFVLLSGWRYPNRVSLTHYIAVETPEDYNLDPSRRGSCRSWEHMRCIGLESSTSIRPGSSVEAYT